MKLALPRNAFARVRQSLRWDDVPVFVRRVSIGVIGATVLLIGIVLIVLPGPAFLVIPLGLAILATEFIWARRWLHRTRELMKRVKERIAKK